ncbi:FMN-binding negative transcriptional regulator [Lapillicoccus jejuensis]|uniref:PaiB family negative transcriptional regulator n=1 Tax=Lapillicoccus jejuensis TaxID=402171 RepID=A0A542E2N4_9MICO|nr:FMN-binding negative transcriptional regulator [Lapillicoccus jejuensis]TQJ09603.1 PaiB family negative transcriptional regulator [Lapillicoccus jejuensis]
MYVPAANGVPDEAEARAMVAAAGAATVVTTGEDGYPRATLLPVRWVGDRVVAHLARANPHWREIADGAPCLLVVDGPQAYVSPGWYASKAEHGRVVPTWNDASVQLRGRATVHDDPAWLRAVVTDLTDAHEGGRPDPWHVTDAPETYVAGQLRGIVGLEVLVEQVTAKAKLSQNRSDADRAGVVAGLAASGDPRAAAVAARMRRAPSPG